MKKLHQGHGKISDHFNGVGTVTRGMVEKRAREIALINGRGPNHYNKDDLEEARRELTGETDGGGEEVEDTVAGLVTWDEAPGQAGRQVRKEEPEDERSSAELLAEEGSEEAAHEQMVEGARNPHNQE